LLCVRADRLVSLVLLLQARGRATASALAAELGVSVRTIYRDMEGLSAAGVPVFAESGPGGGCQLLDGYRFPLRGLLPEEAEALLILGVPAALRELGLEEAVAAAHHQIRLSSGLSGPGAGHERPVTLVHLDMPRWFGSNEQVPQLRTLAEALRRQRRIELACRREADTLTAHAASSGTSAAMPHSPAPPADTPLRSVSPLGLVNKAGTWYLVAATADGLRVFRAERITRAVILADTAQRPPDFDLAQFWQRWSREFEASRPQLLVRLRASPLALAILPEIFGDRVRPAISAASPPDEHGWRELTLSFEHELAAAHRLAGFGEHVAVLTPPAVRDRLVATARGILDRYAAVPPDPATSRQQKSSGDNRSRDAERHFC
jgi:predicted DNA-binding transcriptional regulator YafY